MFRAWKGYFGLEKIVLRSGRKDAACKSLFLAGLCAARSGAVIALGLKAEEFPYLASVRMTETKFTFVSVPAISEKDIQLNPIG